MIFITPGYEEGIGLEVCLNGAVCYLRNYQTSSKKPPRISFIYPRTLTASLIDSLTFTTDRKGMFLTNQQPFIPLHPVDEGHKKNITTICLEYAFLLLKSEEHKFYRNSLLTGPSQKDQFLRENSPALGHTEFLRSFFSLDVTNIHMCFFFRKTLVVLLTEHVSLSHAILLLKKEYIVKKITSLLAEVDKYFEKFDEMLFVGINPHAGEEGAIGTEDNEISNAIAALKTSNESISFSGAFPCDSILHQVKKDRRQIIVFPLHDQGLTFFKTLFPSKGIHLTLGLPFLRASVVHGTARNIFMKKSANYLGVIEALLFLDNFEKGIKP